MNRDLKRFIKAQAQDFKIALAEIKKGKKRSHWMWYIFPQLKGLGFSETSKYYGIESLEEAKEFLNHSELGQNLVTITSELLKLDKTNATEIFGTPDDRKLLSSMTLFSLVTPENPIFQHVLDKFFDGKKDDRTIQLLN
ncbi:MAG: calpastatin [Bacteroidetes bacterium]|nr:calpastatin [Bacteroidota bacterium]